METSANADTSNATEAGAGTLCASDNPLSDLGCINTYKVDSQIFSTMITSGVLGLLFLAAFCFLQTFVSVYRGRLLSPQVAIKPPIFTGNGITKYFYWIWVTISLKEKELLATAGMDALVLERLIVFGLQLMAPITIASCAVLIPVHARSKYLATSTKALQSNLMGLTMSNLDPGSSILWLHFAFVWIYCLYAMWLLNRHYQWYVLLRQQYMTRGDSISTWLGHTLRGQPQCFRNDSMLADSSELHMQQQLLDPSSGFARCTRSQQGSSVAEQEAVPCIKASTFDGVATHSMEATGLLVSDRDSLQQGKTEQAEVLITQQSQQQQQQQPHRLSMQSAFAVALPEVTDGFNVATTNTCSSPDDSRYTSRQSSMNMLLPRGEITKSSSQHLHRPAVAFSADVGMMCLDDEESGRTSQTSAKSSGGWQQQQWQQQKAKGMGFTKQLRSIGSLRTQRSSKGFEELQQQQARQLRHEQEQQNQAAAAAAAEKLGADVEWWAFKTGDPLLDKHVVQVDMASDLAWADTPDTETKRLHLWWEFAPAETPASGSSETADARQATALVEQPMQAKLVNSTAAASSNISAMPGTRLLFDRRSLRARKPSVRFRNTVHVQGLSGRLLPLHVSNYAVLVTDVPGGDGSYVGEEDHQQLEDASSRPGCLARLLQAVIWGWPCLLSQKDLTDLSSTWNIHSFRAKSMQLGDSIHQLMTQRFQQHVEGEYEQLQAPNLQTACSRRHGAAACSTTSSDRQQQCSDRYRLVEKTFKQLFKDDLHAVIPVRNFQAVDELLRQWDRDLQTYIHNKAVFQLRAEHEGWSAPGSLPQHQLQQQQKDPCRIVPATATYSDGAMNLPTPACMHQAIDSSSGELQQELASAHGSAELPSQRQRQQQQILLQALPATDIETGHHSKCAQDPNATAERVKRPAHCTLSLEVHQTSLSGSGGPCRTPRLTPLKPRPVIPQHIMTRPRFVTKDEGEGTTAFGKCCSAVLGILTKGKAEDSDDNEGSNDLSVVAERLEDQRQALVDLEASILEAQKEVLSAADTGAFIVLFKTPAAATLAAHSSVFPQSSTSLEAFKVQPAPSPEDILWQNLWKSPAARRDESIRCLFWYALVYLVPTGIFTAALNSISYSICNSQTAGPKMAWFCQSPFLQFLFTIILPMVLLMLWQNAVIPAYLYKLELRRGAAVSLSEMERNILFIYVGWELVNLFLGGVLSASLTSQIKILTDNPDKWALLLGAAFPNSSNFFLNYIIARAFMMNLFRLIMPHGGMWRWIGQMLFTGAASFKHAATERYRAFIIYPASIRYGREPGLILLILLMGVAYSVAAPLITPFVLAYFCTAYLVWRYQMIYVCVRCYESGGKMWTAYFVIILWCLGLFVVFSSCILIFKQANLQGVLVLPLLPLMYMFARYCGYSYSSRVDHPPLWLAHEAPRTEIDPLVYTPPCLQPHAQGWYFEMGKAWVRWGVPAYLEPNI